MAERISPAVIILPIVALGLAAIAAVAIARRPEEEPPPEEGPPSGEILEVLWESWSDYKQGIDAWQPLSQPLDDINAVFRFRVLNTGNVLAVFKMGYTYLSFGVERWQYSAEVNIPSGVEGNIDFPIYLSRVGTYTKELFLFGNDTLLTSIVITVTVVEPVPPPPPPPLITSGKILGFANPVFTILNDGETTTKFRIAFRLRVRSALGPMRYYNDLRLAPGETGTITLPFIVKPERDSQYIYPNWGLEAYDKEQGKWMVVDTIKMW